MLSARGRPHKQHPCLSNHNDPYGILLNGITNGAAQNEHCWIEMGTALATPFLNQLTVMHINQNQER